MLHILALLVHLKVFAIALFCKCAGPPSSLTGCALQRRLGSGDVCTRARHAQCVVLFVFRLT